MVSAFVGRGLVWLATGSILMSCSADAEKPERVQAKLDSIGSATIAGDGVLTLTLIAAGENGETGHGVVVYRPGEAHYDEVLRHVGPIRPGEIKPVRPWPDEPR
jgi:hypothetical protein